MKHAALRALPLLAAALLMGCATLGQRTPASYALPDELPVVLPAGAGAELAEAHCAACHSLDYIVIQPRNKGAKFWQDSVAKMRTVYGAAIPDDEAAQISTYLAASF